jgi:hypothetical protein
MARHLVEHGAPFVMVANGMSWDNHVFQHEIHQMLVPELDRVLFNLVNDLEERGLLDSTLVIAHGRIRPHALDQPGARTRPLSECVEPDDDRLRPETRCGCGRDRYRRRRCERKAVQRAEPLRHDFTALGINPYAEYDLPGMPTFHRVENKAEPIREILA